MHNWQQPFLNEWKEENPTSKVQLSLGIHVVLLVPLLLTF